MSDDRNLQKAAVLMLSLGEEEAAEVMKNLGPKEMQKLGQAMASMKSVDHTTVESVLNEFIDVASNQSGVGSDSDDYIRSVITKALGEDKAPGLLNRILQDKDSKGIDGLKWMDAQTVADLILNEHPQIIATIMVHLEPDQASEVLTLFTDRLKKDVMLRIATLDGVKPNALKELNDTLAKLLSGNENVNKKQMGGVRAAAEILNFMNTDTEAIIFEGLNEYDADMAQKIMDEMFVFEDIVEIDDKGIQAILKEVQSDQLVVALKGSTDEMKEKIFKNMSSRAGDILKEELENRGPVRLSEVEAMQKEILTVVRRLADSGEITLGGKGAEDQYV